MASKVDRERQLAKKKEITRWCRRWRKRWSETITADNTSKVKKVVKSLLLLRFAKTEANKERQTKIYRKKEKQRERERQGAPSSAIFRTCLTRYRIRFPLQLLMAIVADAHRLQPAARWHRHLVLATWMTKAFAAATTMMLGQSSLFKVTLAGVAQLQVGSKELQLLFNISSSMTHNDLLIGSPVAGRHLVRQHAAQCLGPGTRIAAHRLAKAVHTVQHHLGRVRIGASRCIAALPHMHHLNTVNRKRERERS